MGDAVAIVFLTVLTISPAARAMLAHLEAVHDRDRDEQRHR